METPSNRPIDQILERHAQQPWPELGTVDGDVFWQRLEVRLAQEGTERASVKQPHALGRRPLLRSHALGKQTLRGEGSVDGPLPGGRVQNPMPSQTHYPEGLADPG